MRAPTLTMLDPTLPNPFGRPVTMDRQFLARLATLDVDDVRSLATAYTQWSGVLAAALDTVPASAVAALRNQTGMIRAAVIAAGDGLDDATIEAAKMAVWLYALAHVSNDDSYTVELLREPWCTAILPQLGETA